jgi:hypothetical protein
LAGNGASLDELRDFCNGNDIPARRGRFWSTSTWNSLLEPNVLIQYAGYGVWNVHGKKGHKRPADEWVIVEKAHPPIISEEEAQTVLQAREKRRHRAFDRHGRSRESQYLLSGGLFKCERCGGNMVGFRKADGQGYYVCGSRPYRGGLGCGPGVYVQQQKAETEVMDGLRELLTFCCDASRFTRLVNGHLNNLCGSSADQRAAAEAAIEDVERKIHNVRSAIEDGLADAAWANERLRELLVEKQQAEATRALASDAPLLTTEQAIAFRRDTEALLATGRPAVLKKVVRSCVSGVKLAPEDLSVEIQYKIPEPVVHTLVAPARVTGGCRARSCRRSEYVAAVAPPVPGSSRRSPLSGSRRRSGPPASGRCWPRASSPVKPISLGTSAAVRCG